MNTFKTSEWDSDTVADNRYDELFKGSKKKKRDLLKFSNGKVNKDKKGSVKFKKTVERAGKISLHSKTDVEIIITHNRDRSKRKQKIPGKHKNLVTENNITSNYENNLKERHKKVKPLDGNLENNVLKNQKKIKKNILDILRNESSYSNGVKEKKRRKKLKKKLKKMDRKDIIVNKIIKMSLKTKEIDLEEREVRLGKERRKKDMEKDKILALIQESLKQKKKQEEKLTNQKTTQIDKMPNSLILERKKKLQDKLKVILTQQEENKIKPVLTLRQKMMEKLKAARFRFLNEQIYTTNSKEAQKIFKSDPEAFSAYHEGYRQQVRRWPLNPLDVIIKSIKKMPKSYVIADFGCGDAKLAKSVEQNVHSFDLISVNDSVIACDMVKVPLEDGSVDVTVFCLSLMGTNLHDYLMEANRVLKLGGILKIAEVESRFENIDNFMKSLRSFGFKKTWKDLSHNLFYFMDFKKENNIKNKKKLPAISLLPCLYKKR